MTIIREVFWASVAIMATLACCKLRSAEGHRQRDMRDTSTSAQLTVACSPEKPTAEPRETLRVRAFTLSQNIQSLEYSWSATAGRIVGRGADVRWELTSVIPGAYQATVQVSDSLGRLATCSVEVVLRLPLVRRDPFRETAGSLLLRDEAEREGYGLYSYLLFGSPPTDANGERYRKAIKAYLELIPDITILEKYYTLKELNTTYLPVDSPPEEAVSVDWVLEHYDYARARVLLRTIPGTHRNGPYLISTLAPLSEKTAVSGEYLYQDLSAVPPHLVSLWVKEFLNQAAQERFWERNSADILVLKLRTTIGMLGEGVPHVRNALHDWITLLRSASLPGVE